MQITIFDKNMKKLTALNNSFPRMLHFYNDSWHSYLFEGTETFDFTIQKFSSGKIHKDIQLINDECVIHFKADGKNHLFKIQTLTEDDFNIQLTCDTSILEYTNEQVGAFTNTEAHDIVWYLEKLDLLVFAGTRIGLNEVSNYNRTLSFEGEETKLSRLKSVISQFDAEFDFDIELNSDGSFKGYILNIYHEADNSRHGIGKARGDITLRYGRDVKGVQRVSDSTELFNMSVFTGKDGLSLNDYERSDKDANGNEEFYTRKGSPAVYAPKSAELYPATLSGSDKWTRKDFQTEYENINDLAAHAFKTLKQYAYPKITYTASIQSSFLVGSNSLALGDTVKIYDDNFSDGLILEARVSEKIVSFSNPNNNSIVFSNYKKLTSEISDNLKHRMAAMIEDKMPYAIKLSSNNGLFFKNNKGNTTVSATLVKGTKIIPADWKWTVNEQILSSTDTVTIEASAFEKSLTVTVKAINDKTEVASDQIIFTNVNDGAGVKKITTLTKTSATADISKTGTFTKSAKNPSKSEPYIIGYTETELTDGTIIESDVQVVSERDRIFDDIDSQFAEVTQQITEQQQAHDRTVAEILAQVDSTQSLAEQAKAIGDQAKADAVNLASQLSTAKTALQNSINDTKSQIATVNQALTTAKSELQTQVNAADAKAVQAQTDVDGLKTKAETIKNDLNTAKSELQTQVNAADAKAVQAQRDITQAKSDLQSQASQLITQAAKQVELTKLTTETKQLADGTLTSLNELSKTVDKNTGNITSVANRTKTVEDNLAGVKTNYTQLNQTVNAQTGQITSINQKTAQLESGIARVTERFENLRVGQKNLILNSDKIPLKNGGNATLIAENDYFVFTSTGYTSNSYAGVSWDLSIDSVKTGEEFSILLPVYLDSSVTNDAGLSLAIKNHKLNLAIFNKGITGQSDKWFDFVVTFKANRDLVLDGKSFYLYFTKNGKMRFKKPILVSGNVIPSDWSPADEDTAQQIAEYKRTVDQNYSGLQSTVSTLDGKITQNKSEQVQTADAIKTRLSSLETYKNAEGTRAQAYFEAAKTETAKQITAERSVIARDYTAKSTYTEDVTSIRRTISETKTELGSVTNRTKVVEDDLSGTKTKLEQVKATADTTSRKTAELQSGLDGVQERFESLQVGNKNYLPTSRVVNRGCTNFRYNETSQSWSMTVPTGATTGFGYGITFNTSGLNILLNGGETLFFGLMIKANKTCSFNYDINNTLSGSTSNDNDDINKQVWSPSNKSIPANVWTRVWFSYTAKANVPITESNSNFGIVNNTEAVDIEIKEVIVAKSKVPVDYQSPDADIESKFAEYKRTADQNYSGLQSTISTLDGKITQNKSEQVQTAEAIKTRLSSLETYKNTEGTRAQAYFEAAKTETAKQITAERTAITNNYVAKSTYQEDAAGVTRRLTATETVANRADTTANSAVTKATNAQSTADTAKANVATVTTRLATYQETNDRRVAALETAKHSTDGTLTQLSNKVEQNAQQTRETISAVESKIPTKVSGRNLATGSSDQWNSFITISSNNNWGAKLATVLYGDSTGIYAGTTINIFVYLSADDIVLDSTINPRFFIQGAVIDKQNKVTWTDWDKYNPFFNKWSTNLVAGNNYRVVKLSSKVTAESYTNINGFELSVRIDGAKSGKFHWRALMITTGDIFPDYWEKPVEDLVTEISNAKLDITKTAEGLKLAATKTELTNAQSSLQSGINAAKSAAESAQAKANSNASTITQHATQITALNNELSAKVSKTDYNTLTGRMTSAETTIQAQAGEISKRLTSTQVESAITAKGYQTKAQVDSNIAGRGYITSSALQPYATTTVLENKVRETVDSFNRTISSVRLEIPANASMRNLILKSSDKWGSYVSTNNANSNWCPEICRITLYSDRGISVGKKLNLFVYISADNVTLDSSSNHRMAIQALIKKKDDTNLWHADVPFHGQWSQNLKAGNNYYVIKLTKEIKATAYENGATLIVQCRIDGANHVDFHHRAAMITTGDMFPDTWYPAPEDLATVVAFNKVSDTVDHHAQTLKDQEGRINTVLQTATTAYQLLQDGGRIYEDLKTVKGQIQQVRDANYATRIETLAGSWAVKNLTSGGQILNQINLLANGINHIDGRLTHITGDTLIDRGVIKSAMIGNGQIGTAHIGTIDASQANIINLNVNKLVGFDATFIKGKFDNVIADLLKGKTVAAQNGAMAIDLLNAKLSFRDDASIEFNSDNNTLRRISSSKPSQFIKFTEAGFVSELGSLANSTLTIIGSNADKTETAENQSFGGLRIWNGIKSSSENTSFVEVVGNRFAIYGNKYRSPWVFDATTKTSKLIPMNENGINHSIGRDDKRIWDIHTSNLYLSGKGLKEVINNLYWHITLIYAGNYQNKDKSNMFIF